MDDLIAKSRNTLIAKDKEYNVNHDVKEYFPKGWDSVFTYLNEGLMRLDNLYSAKKKNEKVIEEKWSDLFNYVLISYAVMRVGGQR